MPKVNWDDLRIFLAVARTGRNTAAARRLNLDHTTVTRRVVALETALGATLIHRSPRGFVLTEEGQSLVEYAERIETEANALSESMSGTNKRLVGSVRLATPEAFGSYFVAPNIHQFVAKHPLIELELVPETRTFSLSKREADIAIGISCPTDGRAVVHKLSDYQIGLYASRDYLERVGPITEISQLKDHPFVGYIEDLINLPELRYGEDIVSERHVVFRSTSIAAQQNAVANGTGLGMLHSFSAAQDSRLVPLLTDKIVLNKSYWITVHEYYKNLPRIRAVVAFLHQIVNENRQHFLVHGNTPELPEPVLTE